METGAVWISLTASLCLGLAEIMMAAIVNVTPSQALLNECHAKLCPDHANTRDVFSGVEADPTVSRMISKVVLGLEEGIKPPRSGKCRPEQFDQAPIPWSVWTMETKIGHWTWLVLNDHLHPSIRVT